MDKKSEVYIRMDEESLEETTKTSFFDQIKEFLRKLKII